MRKVLYEGMLRLPFKLGSAAFGVVGFVGSVWPDRIRTTLGGDVNVDTIQLAGSIALACSALYFCVLWLLKPTAKAAEVGSTVMHNPTINNYFAPIEDLTGPASGTEGPPPSDGDTLAATGVLFPQGLYVGLMIVSASKLAEAGNILEIAIRGSNGTGETLRIGGIEGAIYDDTPDEVAELPPPTLREGFASELEPYTEFMAVLDQPLPARLAEQILGLAEGDYVSLDLRDLNIFVELVSNPANRARLPLWDGIGLRRRDDIFTNRMSMMSLNVTLEPVTAVATAVVKDGKRND